MKKIIIIILMLCSTTLMAQRRGEDRQQEIRYDREKLEAARVAFITNRLNLTPSQAEKFWPLFNQNMEQRDSLMREMARINRTDTQGLSDQRANELINKRLEIQQSLLDKEKKFMREITQVISPTQALQLGGVNRDFTRQLYRMQGESRSNRPNN